MSDPDAPRSFLEGIVDQMGSLLGDKAGSAAFQFAARTEGERIGTGYGPGDLSKVMERVDAMLNQKTQIEGSNSPPLRLRVMDSGLLAGGRAAQDAIVLGLLEGVAGAMFGARQTATIIDRDENTAQIEVAPNA